MLPLELAASGLRSRLRCRSATPLPRLPRSLAFGSRPSLRVCCPGFRVPPPPGPSLPTRIPCETPTCSSPQSGRTATKRPSRCSPTGASHSWLVDTTGQRLSQYRDDAGSGPDVRFRHPSPSSERYRSPVAHRRAGSISAIARRRTRGCAAAHLEQIPRGSPILATVFRKPAPRWRTGMDSCLQLVRGR